VIILCVYGIKRGWSILVCNIISSNYDFLSIINKECKNYVICMCMFFKNYNSAALTPPFKPQTTKDNILAVFTTLFLSMR
jgi:hypothetical protein